MKNLYLLLTPSYGSVGDQTITYAELLYLNENYSDYNIITFNEDETIEKIDEIVKHNTNDDLFFLQGGGNLGSLYPLTEQKRIYTLLALKNKSTVIFPQSAFFDDNYNFELAQKAYSKKNVILYAREEESFKLLKKHFPNANILLKPDIVYYLYRYYEKKEFERNGILLSIRKDIERNSVLQNELISALSNINIELEEYSMFTIKTITNENRNEFVENSIYKISTAKAIITDRLHGCIISAITKTPCIVFSNNYHKVVSNYSWLKHLNYIEFVDESNINDIASILNKLISISEKEKTRLDICN